MAILLLSASIIGTNVELLSIVCQEKRAERNEDMQANRLISGQRNEFIEYRGMWTVGYSIVNMSNILELVNFAQDNNFNVVSPLINGDRNGVYYNSKYQPKHVDVDPDFDPLLNLCIEAHKRGIEVHVWIHPHDNIWAFQQHPEFRANGANRFNTNRPDVREYMVDTFMEMASYPIDGLRMDHLYIPDSNDAYTNQLFLESGYTSRSKWNFDMFTEMIRMYRERLNEYKPEFWLSMDGGPGRTWINDGLIDYITPMIYTTSTSSFRSSIRSNVNGVNGKPVIAGPYVYYPGNTAHGRVNSAEEGRNLLVEQIRIAFDQGADGVCLFRYEFLRDNPSFAWALKTGPFSSYTRPPIKEQTVPSKQRRWEFNDQTLREGWELYPRRNDYPLSGQWKIHNAASGTQIVSPLVNIAPGNVTTLEFRARNDGDLPITLSFEWRKGNSMVPDPGNEQVTFTLPPDNAFHVYSKRLDSVEGWPKNTSRNPINILNVSRIQFSIISGNDPGTMLAFDYVRLLSVPICQKEWLLLGPFPNVDYEHAINTDHLRIDVNHSDDLNISICPKPGDIICGLEWQLFDTPRDYIDFKEIYLDTPFNVMYAFSYILAESGGDCNLLVGADDGVKVWINEELVLEDETISINSEPNEFTIPIHVKRGLNTLLVKIAQKSDEFGFFIRIIDKDKRSAENNIAFYPVLPEIPTPIPDDFREGWNDTTPPYFRFNLVKVDDPAPFFDISTYWWAVDSSEPERIMVSEQDRMNGYLNVSLSEQSDGIHVFSVKAQDAFGRNSTWGKHEFYIDRATPSYSPPIPDRTIITPADFQMGMAHLEWTWNATVIPSSGIARTELMVGTAPGKADIDNNTVNGIITSYSFPIMTERYEFVYLTVVPVSGVGIEGPISASSERVTVDFTPPERISSLKVEVQLSADKRSVEAYVISWESVQDRGVGSGIDHYIVEYRSQNMVDWNVLARTVGSDNSHRFAGPGRSERYKFRVCAVDGAGNSGLFSEELATLNLAPAAMISSSKIESGNISSGETILLSSEDSFDPDGEITSYFWNFGDGTFSYRSWAYHTFRYPQEYNLSLTVYDDFGNHNLTLLVLNVTEPREEETDQGSGRAINETSEPPNDPMGENETNETQVEGDGSREDNLAISEILMKSKVGYVLMATLFLFILLFGAVFCSSIIFRRRERDKFTLYKSPGTRQKGTNRKLEKHPKKSKEKRNTK